MIFWGWAIFLAKLAALAYIGFEYGWLALALACFVAITFKVEYVKPY